MLVHDCQKYSAGRCRRSSLPSHGYQPRNDSVLGHLRRSRQPRKAVISGDTCLNMFVIKKVVGARHNCDVRKPGTAPPIIQKCNGGTYLGVTRQGDLLPRRDSWEPRSICRLIVPLPQIRSYCVEPHHANRCKCWGPDLNRRPRGYEPRELPGCSTPVSIISSRCHPASGCAHPAFCRDHRVDSCVAPSGRTCVPWTPPAFQPAAPDR